MTVAVGVGARPGVGPAALGAAIDDALASAGLSGSDVAVLATVDRRAGDAGVQAVAQERGWPLTGLPATELARQDVPNPSGAVAAAVGTPSVAEAAALCAAGPSGSLLLPKRVFRGVTVAIAAL